ncbi:site-specific integrase [Yersinia enterocolitica]|nr:site-specific integrase [Yersinia enterocolitica]
MATIRKRGAYQWETQIRKRGFPSQTKTFNTKAEADAWAKMVESEMARGVWLSRSESESTTLYDSLVRYENEIVANKKGAVQDRSIIRIFKRQPLARCYMASIRSADVAKLRDEWLKDYAPATVLRRLSLLSHLFNISRKEWGMESLINPVDLIRKPQPDNARTRRIAVEAVSAIDESGNEVKTPRNTAQDEIERIITNTQSPILPSAVCLALETAMRRGEIVGLRWKYVDLKLRVAHLPKTKNGDSRDVPLSSKAVAALEKLKVIAEAREESENSTDDRVFKARVDAISCAFDRARKRARKLYEQECAASGKKANSDYLLDLRFHDLRHEATSRLAEIFPMHELTKITGHKDPRMLMRYYHPRAEDLAKKLL